MGKKQKALKAAPSGPKEKHRRQQRDGLDPKAPPPPALAALGKVQIPAVKSKHHSYFEFVENKGHKKKKLEFQITSKIEPPPGFKFVPISSANLTKACKELSRERDAMIFIVSESSASMSYQLSHQLHRFGHHVRGNIVDEARAMIADMPDADFSGKPEPIPNDQDTYTRQVSAAILDLFPNIPNTDRELIIINGFNLADRGTKKVGLQEQLPLYRRVQHAVLAHIRHIHTRYDALLKEVSWTQARKIVEAICLDVLVKWRGDEENGRDQLDEILREVVVISDSDSEESEDEQEDADGEDSDESMSDDHPLQHRPVAQDFPRIPGLALAGPSGTDTRGNEVEVTSSSGQDAKNLRSIARKKQSGFKRYQQAWDDALQRSRGDDVQHGSHPEAVSHGPQHAFRGVAPPAGAAGSVPEPNGYVAPQAAAGPAYTLAVPRPPLQHVNPEPFGLPQHLMDPPRPASPPPEVLQHMLVQSIEPASPDNVKPPAFVRSLPPRAQLSPVRRSVKYPPAPSDGGTRDKPFYVGNNRPAESIAERMYEDPRVHGRSPIPVQRPGHSPAIRNDPYAPPATYGAPAQPPRATAGVARLGDRTRPILMEDRGGFYELVHEPVEPPAAHNATGAWRTDTGRAPDRVVSWEEGSRYMREARNDGDIEIISVSQPQPWPHAPGGPHPYGSARGSPYWENHRREHLPQEYGRPLPGHHQPRQEPAQLPLPYYGQPAPPPEHGQPIYHHQPQAQPPDHYRGYGQHPPPPPGHNVVVLE